MKLAHTMLYKDVKARCADGGINFKEVRKELHKAVNDLGIYSPHRVEQRRPFSVILDAPLRDAFVWEDSPQGHNYWSNIFHA